jgi:hypothetical protein
VARTVEVWPVRPHEREVHITLQHVRAANDLIVFYDLDRDGWVIQSPLWEGTEEVAFIPAWSEAAEAELEAINGPTNPQQPTPNTEGGGRA